MRVIACHRQHAADDKNNGHEEELIYFPVHHLKLLLERPTGILARGIIEYNAYFVIITVITIIIVIADHEWIYRRSYR